MFNMDKLCLLMPCFSSERERQVQFSHKLLSKKLRRQSVWCARLKPRSWGKKIIKLLFTFSTAILISEIIIIIHSYVQKWTHKNGNIIFIDMIFFVLEVKKIHLHSHLVIIYLWNIIIIFSEVNLTLLSCENGDIDWFCQALYLFTDMTFFFWEFKKRPTKLWPEMAAIASFALKYSLENDSIQEDMSLNYHRKVHLRLG